jgi:hypothetical protein
MVVIELSDRPPAARFKAPPPSRPAPNRAPASWSAAVRRRFWALALDRGRSPRCLPPWPRRLLALLLLSVLLGLFPACTNPGSPTHSRPAAPVSSSPIDELNLVSMPVPVNLESLPGIDGIVVKIYAVDTRHPRPQPIRSGTVEIRMFDGLVRDVATNTNNLRHVWIFPAQDLSGYAMTTGIGTGYSLPLGWGKDQPRQDKITLAARYLPPQGNPVYSTPSYVPIPGPAPGPNGP